MNQGHRSRTQMVDEVTAAASFMASLLKMKGLDDDQLQVFQECLQDSMSAHYQHHWYPDTPMKGTAYRCIRINRRVPMDPLLAQAANRSGLTIKQLSSLLPVELTLWVDPCEVCYRIGEDGSFDILYEDKVTSSPAASPVLLADLPYEATSFPVEATSSPVVSPVLRADLPYFLLMPSRAPLNNYYQMATYYRPMTSTCCYLMPTIIYRPCYQRMPIY